jgi:SAM-dependent methyltransferase
MIFSKDILFLHVPKAGGMSITSFLLDALPPPVYYTRPEVDEPFARRSGIVQILGGRHQTLPEAVGELRRYGFSLGDFPLIVAVLRNPYDLEVSRYHYLRAGHPWDYGPNQRLAMTRDFTTFAVKNSLSERNAPKALENYFQSSGEILANLRILRFESLEPDIRNALRSIGIEAEGHFPWRNKSRHGDYASYYTKQAEAAVYRRYRWVFDAGFYERMTEFPEPTVESKTRPPFTAPLAGPVRQEGRADGLSPDCWVDGSLRVRLALADFVSEVILEGVLPKDDSGMDVTLSLRIDGQEAAASFPAGTSVSWTVPCVLEPTDHPELELRSSRTWCPQGTGESQDSRDLAIMLKRIAFVPTARVMKRNWDKRAREHSARRSNGGATEYSERGRVETEEQITSDLEAICMGVDPRAMTVLEIGCGPGSRTAHLADIFGDVRAIDVSAEMIALARENLADHDNVRLYETNGIDLSPFEDELFDFCFASGVFHQLPMPGIAINYLRGVHRTLRSGRLFKFQHGFDRAEMLELADSIGFEVKKTRRISLSREIRELRGRVEDAGTRQSWHWWIRK